MKNKASSLSDLGGLVYSTDQGRMCPLCRQPVTDCICNRQSVPAGDGIVRVSRETKGRGGKSVTVVRGVLLEGPALIELGKQLKTQCGTGGTVRDGVIEVQGDHCDKVMLLLRARGFKIKRSGG
mgnify:FL=1